MLFETLFPNLIFALLFLTVIAFFWSSEGKLSSQVTESGNGLTMVRNQIYLPDLGVLLSNVLLGIFLLYRWFESGHPPMSNLYESLLFLTWSLLLFYLLGKTSGVREKGSSENLIPPSGAGAFELKQNSSEPFRADLGFNRTIGMILLSCALFTYTFATWRLPSEMQTVTPLVPALQSNWLLMHVSIMLLSYAALLGGSLISITYLVLDFVLNRMRETETPEASQVDPTRKTNSSSIAKTYALGGETSASLNETQSNQTGGAISALLVNLDNFSYRSLAFAFPMLTLGIISGAVWANEAWGSYWSWDPKETWALITWFIFAIYLHVRINKGWVGQKAALVATLGFFMVWVCYLGVNLLGKGLHSYGWWN